MQQVKPLLAVCSFMAAAAITLSGQSITITPSYTSIGVNQQLQYTATVTGLPNTKVTWEVSSVVGGNATLGTITQSGLYAAPAVVPKVSTTIIALGSDGKTMGIVYVNVAPAGPAITSISPNPAPTGNPTLTIKGSGFKSGAVVLVGGNSYGTTFVNSTTLTTAPWQGTVATLPVQVQNPGTLFGPAFNLPFYKPGPPPPQTITPTTVTVTLGATQQFTAPNATSFTASAGTITAAGLYTAPGTMPASKLVTVTATGPGGSASATVTLFNPNAQQISPTAVSLNLGATQQFTSVGATSWAASAGTVTLSGLYTAPRTMTTSGTDTVSATGPNGTATATITLIPPAPTITGITPNPLTLGVFSATLSGTSFQASSQVQVNGSTASVTYAGGALNITGFIGQSGTAQIVVSNGSSASAPFSVPVGVQNALASPAAARRFLERAAFGPTPNDAANVQALGLQGWINQQFAMPQISNYNTVTGSSGGMSTHFLTNAVTNPDQLRQRVAFALSQIFVTSFEKLIWNANMVLYQNMLLGDAFTNYRQIMEDVTVSPAMGQYLDMANNAKADPAAGTRANENYARELMQLFTIGTWMLNPDGTLQLDGTGQPIPTYSQFSVTEFARVFTGWTYAQAPGQPLIWNAYLTSYGPMQPYPSEHDFGAKLLLATSPVGATAAAGLTPQQDLDNALDNIFNHPNVAPFVSKLLIQHLVKSNPSPAYVARVAAAFNGATGAPRGDMKATIGAILLDPEATANDEGGNNQPTDGHLQEPALFLPSVVRAFGGTMNDQNYYASELANMGQDVYSPPSVFNYYSPGYVVGGTGGLKGPEFQIFSPDTAIVRANEIAYLFSQYANPVASYGPGTTFDLSPFLPLAATPSVLADALDLTLTHGKMPSAMKTALVNAITAETGGPLRRVQTACYLILTSNYYNVWH